MDAKIQIVALFTVINFIHGTYTVMPETFTNEPEVVKAVKGKEVILPCTSDDTTPTKKVMWVNPRKTVISLDDSRMIDDQRMSVNRPYLGVWNLLIRDVRFNDTGVYECRVNTNPEKKRVRLIVQASPTILTDMSSDKITLIEGETGTLICNVTGVPQPNVTWYKSNYRDKSQGKQRIGEEGEVLLIRNVSRHCDDVYECVVDNGVPPTVSKSIRVHVDYPPTVMVPSPKKIGQSLRRETVLECQATTHPANVLVWMKDGEIIRTDERRVVEIINNDMDDSSVLTLRIREVRREDFGRYICMASNYLGENRDVMILHEIRPPTPKTTTTTTTTTRAPRIGTITRTKHPDRSKNGYNTVSDNNLPRKSSTMKSSQNGGMNKPDGSSYPRVQTVRGGQMGNPHYDTGNDHLKEDPDTGKTYQVFPSDGSSLLLTHWLCYTLNCCFVIVLVMNCL